MAEGRRLVQAPPVESSARCTRRDGRSDPGRPPCLTAYVVRGGALGDFVLSLPAIAAVRAAFPGDPLCLVAQPSFGQLAVEADLCDLAPSIDGPLASELLHRGPPSQELRARFADAAAAVVWSCDREGRAAANLAAVGVPRRLVADPFPLESSGLHCADHLVQTLDALGVHGELPAVPRLPLPRPRDWSPRRVAIHPGSGSPRKNWPLPRFVELARRLEAAGREVVWLLGPAERESSLSCSPPATSRVAETPDVSRLARVLTACGAYVGNDSGVTHLAAALGLAVVALFGPSDPRIWAPRGKRVRLQVTAGSQPAASEDEALEALSELTT